MRPAHLATLLRQVGPRAPGGVVAVQVTGTWAGEDTVPVDGQVWQVVRAHSQLAIREALVAHEERRAEPRLVILTPLDTLELGWDIRARLTRQRVFVLHAWELLGDLFRARAVDPRVARLDWLADVLLEQAPPGGYAPAPSGVLDLETAWAHALGALLGLPGPAPDALTLLRWSARDGAVTRWQALSAEARAGVTERFTETAGTLGSIFAASVSAGNGARLVALGLVCDVLWPDASLEELAGDATLRDTLAAARVRFEPYVGGSALREDAAREWAAHAQRVLAELTQEQALEQRRAAETILDDIRAGAGVVLSRVLPGAAALRASRFARSLREALEGTGTLQQATSAQAAFAAHADVAADLARAERALMALRLVRAFHEHATEGEDGFGVLVRRYVTTSSWMDAARTALLGGDVHPELASLYADILRRGRERREAENRAFAERLVVWNASPVAEPGVVPVERALELVVAPVADVRPVLVVVLDGLDLGVWRLLHADMAARGWTWWQPATTPVFPVAVATLPSVTSAARASLFAGAPKAGSQATEKPDFAAHSALRRSTTGGRVPALFHKGELGTANALAAEVRRSIADRQQRVVGAVINAVDDWLDRSDQVLPRWTVAAVPLLEALLQEAALAGRAVAVLSDHGHLLDHESMLHRGGEGARWRLPSGGLPAEGEVLASGPRVRAVTGEDAIVLAWSESLRYTGKKTGYHGGATPQEVIAPIALLSRDELGVEGWRPTVDAPPAWWSEDGTAPVRPSVPVTPSPVAVPVDVDPGSSRVSAVAAAPAWIDALLSSPVYTSQRALAGRAAPREDQLRGVLEALAQHELRIPRTAVAAVLGLPELRVRGVVAGVRRVLNVDGFAVLEEEESTGTLTLNLELLRAQFGLES